MSAKDKLNNLKSELKAAVALKTSCLGQYSNALCDAIRLEDEIKALEEALAPKQGDIYKHVNTSQEYILARVAYRKYSLINLQTGERYLDANEDMDEVFGNNSENFVKIRG